MSASRPVLLLVLGAFLVMALMRCDGEDPGAYSPTVELLCPSDTILCGMPCFVQWSGSDRDGHVEGYYYGLNDDTPETWTAAEACTLLSVPVGRHLFFLQAQDNDGRRSGVASCVFVVRQGACRVSPSTIDFGSVDLGGHLDGLFTISNVSEGFLNGEVSALCDGFEVVSGGGVYSLGGGETRSVAVRFSPSSCGPSECSINTGSEDCPSVLCRGVGGGTGCDVSPASLDFGVVNIGETAERSFTISNTGCTSLVGDASVSGEGFSVVRGGAYSLEPGQSVSVTLRFRAGSCGISQGAVTMGNENCTPISCSAAVEGAACEVYPAALDFGRVAKGTERFGSFWIRNIGCTDQEGYLSVDCQAYSLVGEPSWGLAPGESLEVRVKFSPSSCEDEELCLVDTGNSLTGSVSCTAKVGCGCWVSDEDLYHDFGTVDYDLYANYRVDIQNLSCDTLDVDVRLAYGCPGEFQIKAGGGHLTLAPDGEHSVFVRFSPTESKTYVCYLDLGECGRIKLTGKGPEDDTPVPP